MGTVAKKVLTCFACVFPFLAYPFVLIGILSFEINRRPTHIRYRASLSRTNELSSVEPAVPTHSWPTNSPQYFSQQAANFVAAGQIEDAIAFFQKAIEHNPDDLAVAYRISSPKSLLTSEQDHGELQVRTMIRDRPAMGEYTTEGDFLWKWAARKFAGEDLATTIDWDSTSPRLSWAEHESLPQFVVVD